MDIYTILSLKEQLDDLILDNIQLFLILDIFLPVFYGKPSEHSLADKIQEHERTL